MLYILNINSVPPLPLEIDAELFLSGVNMVHVFSFSSPCVSIGRLCDMRDFVSLGFPVFKRATGGGAVIHSPFSDISFGFTIRVTRLSLNDIFYKISGIICEFFEQFFSFDVKHNFHGDIFLNNIKICGISAARKRNFFLFEGCFLFPQNLKLLEKGRICFPSHGRKIENFSEIATHFFFFLREKIALI